MWSKRRRYGWTRTKRAVSTGRSGEAKIRVAVADWRAFEAAAVDGKILATPNLTLRG